ncbi:MAG: lipid-A-disaccharide synthase, partial [Opitutae bacterium]
MSETGNSPILELPSPQAERPDLLVIAGEHSGDEHAARMVAELLKEKPGTQVAALGGRHLEA